MRLLNQSQLIDGSPYRHLGYTAATYVVPDRMLTQFGTMLMLAGIGIALASAVLPAFRKHFFGHRTGWSHVLLALIGAAVVVWGLSLKREAQDRGVEGRPQNRMGATAVTESRVFEAGRLILEHYSPANRPPAELADMPEALQACMTDQWGRKMQISFGNETVDVRSAGADGRFDTIDDIVGRVEPGQTRPRILK